ncbi:MAG: D-alanyl-D-alanine carboxypeptidase family protein [Brasilonema octagenarum HA4186-MV1]|uniref:Peptidase M15 n=1 Tax=Brasilonema octagenarum UFV-OR1 TaxID=417115 RepID=A0ABX1MF23_9CYAN|nr:D-alanyl-D-alanine carboxypeptidase family protein [Brasilonema octagenarum HA4186-MV1]NMF67175.1 peptidase M15 [Brasilonema octagenarum UFV-OR1]
MKTFLKKAFFYMMIAFLSCALVASHGISRDKLMADVPTLKNCVSTPSLENNRILTQSCTNVPQTLISPTPSQPFTPNQNLTEKDRFLSAVTNNLLKIPTPHTFEYILLRAYGSVFVNQDPQIKLPPKVLFTNDQETKQFQSTLTLTQVKNTSQCYLQKSAADAFDQARSQVQIPLKSGYGASDCSRSFATNLRFWQKYADNKTLEQVRQGKETKILGLVAPPGASQHLWGLAIDLRVTTEAQKQALNQYGWYRTVENDIPHWTYVGLPPEKLTEFGFQNKVVENVTYWLTPL